MVTTIMPSTYPAATLSSALPATVLGLMSLPAADVDRDLVEGVPAVPAAPPVAAPRARVAVESAHRAAMVEQHMPLVRYVAGKMGRLAGSSLCIDYDDLVGYGCEGLLEAIDTFNPTFNVKFSTWAVMHIRTTIQDAVRKLDPLPRSLRTKSKEIERVSYELANVNGVWPTDEQLAEALGMPVDRLRSTKQDINKVVVSLDNIEDAHGEDTGYSWMSLLADEDPLVNPEASLDSKATGALLVEIVRGLPERERFVIVAYYKQERPMRDIAAHLGVSESRISQLHARALKLLRQALLAAVDDTPRERSLRRQNAA